MNIDGNSPLQRMGDFTQLPQGTTSPQQAVSTLEENNSNLQRTIKESIVKEPLKKEEIEEICKAFSSRNISKKQASPSTQQVTCQKDEALLAEFAKIPAMLEEDGSMLQRATEETVNNGLFEQEEYFNYVKSSRHKDDKVAQAALQDLNKSIEAAIKLQISSYKVKTELDDLAQALKETFQKAIAK